MAIAQCPNCERIFDFDGFFEHGVPTLYYCECGKVYDKGQTVCSVVEVPIEEVDLTGIEGHPIPKGRYRTPAMSRGLYINKSRWEKPSAESA